MFLNSTKININIGYIETEAVESAVEDRLKININIGYIETPQNNTGILDHLWININIGYIETTMALYEKEDLND